MIDKIKVIHIFRTYSELDRNACLKYDQIIDISIAEIASKLKPDIDFDKNSTIIHYLCGITAYYRYMLMLQSDFSEVKMGNVTIKKRDIGASSEARELLNDATALASSILIDDFYFDVIH